MRVEWAGGLCGSVSLLADGTAVIRCFVHFYNNLEIGRFAYILIVRTPKALAYI